jgi:hypothetical protein
MLIVRNILRRGVLDTTLCDKVSDLWQVGGFLWVLQFPPPQYNGNIVESGVKHTKKTNQFINGNI